MNINIRKEKESDIEQIFALNKLAFCQGLEAEVVDNLRKADCDIISFVAEIDNKVVGHIMFSPVTINGEIIGMGLAPLGILPDYQKQGIGTKLVETGIKEVMDKEYRLISVIGHPKYYPRFGFVKASDNGLKSQYDDIADEAFMILNPDNKHWDNETIYYRDEFKIFGFG